MKDQWTGLSATPFIQTTQPNLDTFQMTSNEPYTPTSSTILTPESATNNNCTNDTQSIKPSQWNFNYSPDFDTQGLPDISSMMFPSEDPFAYPTQPMITLEDGQFAQSPTLQNNSGPLFDMSSTSTSSLPYDNIEAQLFGPLPPYLMQGQTEREQDFNLQDLERQIAMTSVAPNEQVMGYRGDGTGLWPPEQQQQQQQQNKQRQQQQQHKLTQDLMTEKQQAEVLGGNLFGDWNVGWRNQAYRQG